MAKKKNTSIQSLFQIYEKTPFMNLVMKLFVSIGIVYTAYHFAKYISKMVIENIKKTMPENKKLIVIQMSNIIFYTVFAIGIVMALINLGIQPTALSTMLGTVMVTIGLGMQNVLSNIFSGVSVVLADSFRSGDIIRIYVPFINSQIEGQVEDLNVNYVILKETQSQRILYIPNSIVASNMIVNLSRSNLLTI